VKIIKVILVTIFIIVMQGFGWAGDLDSMLSKAAEEKKLVMLELGSVGCIPCEQMKPVMSKLSSTYKGKL
jgi:thioredoxin 1